MILASKVRQRQAYKHGNWFARIFANEEFLLNF